MSELDRTLFQKDVIVPFSGQRFSIRRVRFKNAMAEIGGLPLGTTDAVQHVLATLREKAKSGDVEAEEKITRYYITKGVVSPKVWFGPESDCPDGQIFFEDLGSDLDMLAGEIINYSSGMAGLKAMENFFRESGAGDPGLNGEALRPAPVEPPPAGDA